MNKDAMYFSRTHTCLTCGTQNKIPSRYLAEVGRCGVCKARIPPLAEPLEVDQASFENIVFQARVPVLVAFRASWCRKSRVVGDELRALAYELSGQGIVISVYMDAYPDLMVDYRIRSMPTYVLFRDGRPVVTGQGKLPVPEIRRWMEPSAARAGNPADSPWPRVSLGPLTDA